MKIREGCDVLSARLAEFVYQATAVRSSLRSARRGPSAAADAGDAADAANAGFSRDVAAHFVDMAAFGEPWNCPGQAWQLSAQPNWLSTAADVPQSGRVTA